MSKSSNIFSVSVAEANAEGGDVDSHLMPDPDGAGVTFVGMATTEGSVDSFAFEEGSHTQEGSRSTPGQQALAPVSVRNTSGATRFGVADGDFLRVGYPDSIELTHRLRGAQGAAPTTQAWGKILGSGLGLFSPSVATASCSEDGSADGSDFKISLADKNAAGIQVGSPVRVKATSSFVDEYAIITKITDDGTDATCKVYPSFSFQQTQNASINFCFAYYPVIGRTNAAQKDLHVRFAMGAPGTSAGVQTLATGCRLTGFTISEDGGIAQIATTMRPMAVVSEDELAGKAGVVAAPESPGFPMTHRAGCRLDMGINHKSSSAPVAGARSYLPNFNHTVTVSVETGEGTPETRSILRGLTHEIHNATCQVSIVTEKNTTFQQMLVKDERRALFLGYGPSGSGEGCCFAILNASRDDGSSSTTAGDQSRIQQTTNLRAVEGQALCDVTGLTDAEKRLAQAPFMLIFPKA